MNFAVVTKKIISEAEARELFRMYVSPMLSRGTADLLVACRADRFYHGCSTFLPVFDASVDTYDALHERSPFAVDVICMVAAKVRDGGGKSHRLYHLNEACLPCIARKPQ